MEIDALRIDAKKGMKLISGICGELISFILKK